MRRFFYVDPERGDMAGDTILLRSGYHGEIYSRGAYNDDYITISGCRGGVIIYNLAYNPYGGQ